MKDKETSNPQMESEIKLKDLSPSLASTIITICIVGIIMMILFSWAITNLQNQIKDLPHKYCHNETINIDTNMSWLCDGDYCIKGCLPFPIEIKSIDGTYCKHLETKEICEIR